MLLAKTTHWDFAVERMLPWMMMRRRTIVVALDHPFHHRHSYYRLSHDIVVNWLYDPIVFYPPHPIERYKRNVIVVFDS
jgi:hypothetical protein